MLNAVDFSPLFRTTIGFDRLTNSLDQTRKFNTSNSYPPYNIEKLTDDDYKIVMAVAGCTSEDIEVTEHDGCLVVKGEPKNVNIKDSYYVLLYIYMPVIRPEITIRLAMISNIFIAAGS